MNSDAKMKDEPTTFQNLEYEKGSRLLNFTPLQFFFTLASVLGGSQISTVGALF